jgi:hypothetical protein
VVLLAVAAAYSLGAATTHAFTSAADLVTALPIVGLVLVAIAQWPCRPVPAVPAVPEPVRVAGAEPPPSPPPAAHPFRAWIGLLAVLVAFELLEYFARGSRGAHPTLSSIADALDRQEGLKALVFLAWLCLGAAIVAAGRRGSQPQRVHGDPAP